VLKAKRESWWAGKKSRCHRNQNVTDKAES
jgi:hypothetical protein